jgi:hypothetical protein
MGGICRRWWHHATWRKDIFMNQSIVLRFYGRFVFVIDTAQHQCHVLAVNPYMDLSIPNVHDHKFLLNVRRQAVNSFPREPTYVIAVGPEPTKAEHSLWEVGGLDAVVGAGNDFTLVEGKTEIPDLKFLTDGKAWLDPGSLRAGALNGLIKGAVHLMSGVAMTQQIDMQACEYVPLGNDSPAPHKPAPYGVADMVEVTFNVDELVIGGFRIAANEYEKTFVNFSNLCCHTGVEKDSEFAAYYRTLSRGMPPDNDRLVPMPTGGVAEKEHARFFEVDCYKPAKIVL